MFSGELKLTSRKQRLKRVIKQFLFSRMGDLNYRVDLNYIPETNSVRVPEISKEEELETVLKWIEDKNIDELCKHDELQVSYVDGFHSF